ncbi:Uncharacterised protein [Vibrio cholerae]|nr:Uncharacterised protein [Vibrio cholerae]
MGNARRTAVDDGGTGTGSDADSGTRTLDVAASNHFG